MSDEFRIHLLNNYSNIMLRVLMAEFEMTATQMGTLIRESQDDISRELSKLGVRYLDPDLAAAITPRPGKEEVAFVFDTSKIDEGDYGTPIAEAWIPALRGAAPKSSNSILTGDIVSSNPPLDVYKAMRAQLVERRPYLFRAPNQFHVIYITNLTPNQRHALDQSLFERSAAYVGYVDCSLSSAFKSTLFLPALGVRLRNKVLMPGSKETDRANSLDYPFDAHGFTVLQVEEALFELFLHFKIDNGHVKRGMIDGVFSLIGLGNRLGTLDKLKIEVDERRFSYLIDETPGHHGASLRRAGIINLDRHALASLVEGQLSKNLIFNLRSVAGSREENGRRIADSSLDALMFSVQIEVTSRQGLRRARRRLTVGVKYFPVDHRGEVATMYD